MSQPVSQPDPSPPQVQRNALTPAQLASLGRGGQGWEGALPLPKSWRLGVVVGSPASGKSSLLRCSADALGVPASSTESFQWPANKAVVSCMDASPDEAIATMQSCGLASTPALLRPFGSYSGGERQKASLARGALAGAQLFDDFGAAVSKDAAKSAAAGFARLLERSERIKRNERRVVANAFRDIAPFLGADWALDLDSNTLVVRCEATRGGDKGARHPEIIIEDDQTPLKSFELASDTPREPHAGETETTETAKGAAEAPASATTTLTTEVEQDACTRRTAATLADPFDGKSTTVVHAIPARLVRRARATCADGK